MNYKINLVIADAKREFPLLRLGQLILNAIPEDKLYYITDADFADAIWAYIAEHGDKK